MNDNRLPAERRKIRVFSCAASSVLAGLMLTGCVSAGHSAAGKVTICHKEKNTITVSENALEAHLAHGDYPGACPVQF